MPKQIVQKLLRTKQTVFSVKELALLLRTIEPASLIKRLHYYVQKGELYHIRRGLYALDKDYNRLEVATKICTPSYISFESVLMPAGVIFQYYSQIFVATYQSREVVCDHQSYIFRRIKPVILTTGAGVAMREAYSIASVERAFLDLTYLTVHYHFDNLAPLNWDTVYELLPIYEDNKSMRQRVDRYYAAWKNKGNV